MASSLFFFDEQDHELLRMLNQVLESKTKRADWGKAHSHSAGVRASSQKLFDGALHPHGIKELALSREIRIASSVINLLYSLEEGRIGDRLTALKELRDEVLYSATSGFRRNTGRVLIQIMKDLVRGSAINTEDNQESQLRLANDFRRAVSGRRRVIRAMLKRYHLVEMPEEWDQITFDNHVHDANTKGRKTPTHLVMDAWIKGIRSLTVIYYNYVDPPAVQELLRAAKVMDIAISIGLEYRAVFYGRFVDFIWEPGSFSDERDMLEFLDDAPVRHLMREGRAVSRYHESYTLMLLNRFNLRHRQEISEYYGVELADISPRDFMDFVGTGQASLLHLSEMIQTSVLEAFNAKADELRQELQFAEQNRKNEIEAYFHRANQINFKEIVDNWLGQHKNSDLPDPHTPRGGPDVPDLLNISPRKLADWLGSLSAQGNITLNLLDLSDADVLELLYDCEGMISHLELFNLKDYKDEDLPRLQAISDLQMALNTGSAVAIKRLTRSIINAQGCSTDGEGENRCKHFNNILRNIPKLQSYYRDVPLMSTMGTDSTGRAERNQGMGLVFPDTLPRHARKAFIAGKDKIRHFIPVEAQVYSSLKCYPRILLPLGTLLTSLIRRLPGCAYFGYRKVHSWVYSPDTAHYVEADGNIATLGGAPLGADHGIHLAEPDQNDSWPGIKYLNNSLANYLKVISGFVAATLSFLYTQDWWVMAWFGAAMFFGITWFRNILQSVLGGGGIRRSPLLRWNDYVSWNRICDSLFYTGFSVPLLEVLIRSYVLESTFGLTAANSPTLVFSVISAANGAYITAHNIYRGLPKEAVYGNIFRSIFAIPVAIVYNWLFMEILLLGGVESAAMFLTQSAAVISKAASDSVAGMVEGFADGASNLRLRRWDYSAKIKQLFDCFAKLELLFPDKDVLELLLKPKELMRTLGTEAAGLEKTIIINALDLMYFWMYQPRARTMLEEMVAKMTPEEKIIFASSQLVLIREKEISRLFVDGMLGRNFSKALSFYLDFFKGYLKDMEKVTGVNLNLDSRPRAV